MTRKHYPPIKYTSRDFNSIKSDLVDYAKRYYSNTFKDFSESGFGSLMLDTVSYVGDILSFYLDYSVNESFLDTAIEYKNVLKIGHQMGYKFNPSPSSYGLASFYVIVPTSAAGRGPDSGYIPILRRGTQVSSIDGIGFLLNEDVNFADPNNEVVVARVDSINGTPTSYAIKAKGQVLSGDIEEQEITIGTFQKFLRLKLDNKFITEIISIIDIEGNEYFEVDYLTQDVIYKSTLNRGSDSETTQANLRPFVVPRRFITERTEDALFLQFGFGSKIDDSNVDPIIDPSLAVLNMHGRDYVSDINFDPTNFLKTDKMGIVPSNTVLIVTYRTNRAGNVNVGAESLINVDVPLFDFPDLTALTDSQITNVVNSLEVTNDDPILGDVTLPTSDELKTRIYNVFGSQNRAVTLQDYKSLCYSMPPQFGAIKRINIIRDPESFRRNLNLYVLSEDEQGYLTQANDTIKENLKQWINQGRMINDTIDILNAKIVNIGFEFTAIATMDSNKYAVLQEAIDMLANYYSQKLEIGEPFYITDIYNQLNKMDGIIDVSRVKVVRKSGANYAPTFFDVDAAFSDDGRYIKAPHNVIFELRYPDVDIKGSIK